MLKRAALLFLLGVNGILITKGQDSLPRFKKEHSILDFPEKVKPGRLAWVMGISATASTGMFVWLDQEWYAQYPRSRFKWFDDSKEWLQIDKIGHAYSNYIITDIGYNCYRWIGLKPKHAAIAGGATSWLLVSTIELLDGTSEKWGASASDLIANSLGVLLSGTQLYLWQKQKIRLKNSFHFFPYPSGVLGQRSRELYGTGPAERLLKDYNNINIWLSVNPSDFNKRQQKLTWLSVAVGYGAGDMYGGFSNVWKDENGVIQDFSHVQRYRKFFVALDYDLSKIRTPYRLLNGLLYATNYIKLPSPAIEFNTKGQVIFHPLLAIGFEMPLYVKR